eukprot:CAMPEP_0170134464 /NCGR_PEP_ID=MMETSP0033_2-20121228/1914_1 /TAXON_ID=195969 /ORGANISM="Dolichomastix tenuilepis, Strain CCMP3274" /LENGTH=178 /DNA_ID=CAMNT_0010370017 /DNA_START=44 /DNA_END=580 /DNA_ORIENTATION=+
MIKSFLVINNHGKPRLVKFYEHMATERQQELIKAVYGVVSKRDDSLCSFVDDETAFGADTKVVYRHFATLYFIVLCDRSESELGILDLIQVYVETLDRSFDSVCELDIIFNPPKAHAILDEIVMGGEVLETSASNALKMYLEQERLEKIGDPTAARAQSARASKFTGQQPSGAKGWGR